MQMVNLSFICAVSHSSFRSKFEFIDPIQSNCGITHFCKSNLYTLPKFLFYRRGYQLLASP